MTFTIKQEKLFKETPQKIYQALIDSAQFSQVTGGAPTEISSESGGAFSLFGGMIYGRNIELISNVRMVQAWRAGNWEEGVYSIVKIELKEKGEETLLELTHTGFPEGQGEHLSTGWEENYWGPLKKYLEK
ncbi:SRPBCC domain-containing protein [Metabacillus herbersteinensis]|uniref:SRPBCC domain-containing protein n=1 Tax=Metabacillus herbersteinensis TaxID=283816 RepID=A0ABV6GH20_9BACI